MSRRTPIPEASPAGPPGRPGRRERRVGDVVLSTDDGVYEIELDGERYVVLGERLAHEIGSPSPAHAPALPARASVARYAARRPAAGAEHVQLALTNLLAAFEEVQAAEAAERRPELVKAMSVAGIDPVPATTVAQARRLARQRSALLASGAFTTEALRQLRGAASSSATRTWLTRQRSAGKLFTVSHDGATLVPAFQLDDDGVAPPALRDVLSALAPAHLNGWATWTWFATPSTWLGGRVPAGELAADPAAVLGAAQRFVSNAA